MARKFFVGGNWKMNGTKSSIDEICSWLVAGPLDPNTEVVVGVPGCYIQYVADKFTGSALQVAAQNCYKAEKGAFTGELAPAMIKDCGANWVIIGHSERRNVFGEQDDLIGEKVGFALKSGLSAIPCIGEKLEEREAGKTTEVVFRQLSAMAPQISDWSRVVLAYEPVWAIGTGITATPDDAQSAHSMIRSLLGELYDAELADSVRIIYGGSVKAANAAELFSAPDVDGGLIGGASLKVDEFASICRAAVSA